MGSGIAEVFASAGHTTILYDVNNEVLLSAKNKIQTNLQRLVEKNKMEEEEAGVIFKRIFFTTHIGACKASLIIEAIIEDLAAKVALFNELKRENPQAVFASNTSSLSIAAI